MKTTKTMLFSALLMLSLSACSKKIMPDKMPANQLIFGSGGGFTGLVKEYCLLEDGRIVEKAKDGSVFNVIATIDRDKAEQAFQNCRVLGLDNLKFQEPSNMYQFISVHMNAQTENRIVWGNSSTPPPSEVMTLYNMLISYLPKIKAEK